VDEGNENGAILWWSAAESPVPAFAAAEVQRYVQQMSGVSLPIVRVQINMAPSDLASALVLVAGEQAAAYRGTSPRRQLPADWLAPAASKLAGFAEDSFVAERQGSALVLAGRNQRGTLYAAYDFLTRQGCRFFAPAFAAYSGHHEEIPSRDTIDLLGSLPVSAPSYSRRGIYGGGETTRQPVLADLIAIFDWMAKNGLNTYAYPVRFGLAQWDSWRSVLLPEVAKRDVHTRGQHLRRHAAGCGRDVRRKCRQLSARSP
jgi:hypothetical protein